MRIIFLVILTFVSTITKAQITSEEKQTIENYTHNVCSCVNSVMKTLDAKVQEFVYMMAEKGEDVAMKKIQEYVANATEEDAKRLIASFDSMSSKEFGLKMEACDNLNILTPEIKNSIDNMEGVYSDYFYGYLKTVSECKLTNYFMELGNKVEETKQ